MRALLCVAAAAVTAAVRPNGWTAELIRLVERITRRALVVWQDGRAEVDVYGLGSSVT